MKFNRWTILAIISGLGAAVAIVLYALSLNMAMIIIILPAIAATGFCLYKTANFGNVKFEGISEQGPVIGAINAFCIYGKKEGETFLADKVQFESLTEEEYKLGDRWFFEDLNKWLYVIYNDIKGEGAWKAFELPDAAYTDPARLSIQLNMGRVNELFQLEPSLFDQLKPWILFAAISVIGFLIFLSGSG